MKKFLKIGGISLLLVFVILLALPFLFKGKIIQSIKEETNKNINAKVNFSDDIGLSLIKSFPKLQLDINQLSIVGVDTFRNDTLAYLPKLSITMNLMSVIKGEKIEINRIYLQEPMLNVLVLENGKANYDIAKADSSAADTSASTFKMALDEFEISNGNLVYEDKSLTFYTSLKHFNHSLKGDFTSDRFLLETKTQAEEFTLGYGGMNYIYKVAADLGVNLDMDMKAMKFTFKDNDILLNQLNLGGEGFVDMNDNDMDFDIVFKSKKTDFKTIMSLVPGVYSKSFDQAKAKGSLDFGGYLKGKMTDDRMPGFGLKLNIDNGYFQYPDLPKSLNNIFVNLAIDNQTGYPDNTVIDLKRFDANIAGEPIHASLLMKTPLSNPFASGALKGNVNLAEFRSFIPLDKSTEISGLIKSDISFKGYLNSLQTNNIEKFYAAGTIAAEHFHYKDPINLPQGTNLDASMGFNPQTIALNLCKGNIGMSDFDAKGQIDNLFAYMLRDELLKGSFTLNSNYMNVNEFLSEEKEVKKEPSAADSIPMQAFEVPGNIDFVFNSNINTMVYDNLKLTNLGGRIILKQSQMFFENLGLNLLGGSISLNGVYDSKNPKFPFSNIDFGVKSLDIIQTFNTFDMVKKLMPIAQYTKGLFNADIHLANNFNQDLSVSYPTVTGGIKLGIAGAAIKDLPILNIIADKLKIDKLKNLSLNDLNLKLNIANGKVALDSMILPLWTGAKAKISGYTALDQSIQYVAKLSIPRKDFGEANTALNTLTAQAKQKGLNVAVSDIVDVDVLIGGFFTKPDVKISLHDAKNSLVNGVKDQLKAEADKQVQATLDEAKRRAILAKQKTLDSLAKMKQIGIEKLNAEKKLAADKLAEEKRVAEERIKAEADKVKSEADKKLQDAKKKALDGIKGGLLRK
jgi:hypothetical protein